MKPSLALALIFTLSLLPAQSQAAPPLASGLDPANFDASVRPQDDLFRAVNGTWLAKTEIPADRADYGAFTALAEQAEKDVSAILEECAKDKDAAAGSERQKVGNLYAAFMDADRAEQLGIEPIAGTLASIDQIATKADLVRVLAELSRGGVSGLFGEHVGPDAKHSDRYIIHLSQAGLGLPDRDYYLDAKYKDKLAAYGAHVEKMLQLAKIADAKRLAGEIVALETQVAMAQWSKMANRDNVKTYNKKTRDELAQLAPGFDWNQYLDVLGAGAAKEFIVGQPSFFTAAAKLTDDVPLATWRAWLKWRVVQHYASVLNKELVDESFAFYGTTLHGIPRNRPRWKRAVETVQGSLGEAVGKLYVRRHFSPAAKARMDTMVKNVIASYHQAFLNVAWMSPQTREKALAKLATFNPKIGYPKQLARLLRAADHSRRPGGQPASRHGLRVEPRPRQARQAGGPRRVVHDPADGQRLLQPEHERDRLPGGDPATALLQPRGRRRRQLRRHRRRDRPRDGPRLRRPGLEMGRRRQPRRLVDAGRPQGVRPPQHRPGRTSSTSTSPFPASTSTAASPSARTSPTWPA